MFQLLLSAVLADGQVPFAVTQREPNTASAACSLPHAGFTERGSSAALASVCRKNINPEDNVTANNNSSQ